MPVLGDGSRWSCQKCVTGHRASDCQHWDNVMLSRRGASGRPIKKCPHAAHPCECDMNKERYIFVMMASENGEYTCKPQFRGQPADRCTLEGGRDLPLWPGYVEEPDKLQPAKPAKRAKSAVPQPITSHNISAERNSQMGGTQGAKQAIISDNAVPLDPFAGEHGSGHAVNPQGGQSQSMTARIQGIPEERAIESSRRMTNQAAGVDYTHGTQVSSNFTSTFSQPQLKTSCCQESSSIARVPHIVDENSISPSRKRRRIDDESHFHHPSLPTVSHSEVIPNLNKQTPGSLHIANTYPRGGPPPHHTNSRPVSTVTKDQTTQEREWPFTMDFHTRSPNKKTQHVDRDSAAQNSYLQLRGQKNEELGPAITNDSPTPVKELRCCESKDHSRSSNIMDLRSTAASENCQCGQSCNCLWCATHYDNPSTREVVYRMSELFEQQSFDGAPSRPSTSYGKPSNLLPLELSSYSGFDVSSPFAGIDTGVIQVSGNEPQPHHIALPDLANNNALQPILATDYGAQTTREEQNFTLLPWETQMHGAQQADSQAGNGNIREPQQQQRQPDLRLGQISQLPQYSHDAQQSPGYPQSQQYWQQNGHFNFLAYPTGGCGNDICLCGSNCKCEGCRTHHGHIYFLDGSNMFDPVNPEASENQGLPFSTQGQAAPNKGSGTVSMEEQQRYSDLPSKASLTQHSGTDLNEEAEIPLGDPPDPVSLESTNEPLFDLRETYTNEYGDYSLPKANFRDLAALTATP